MQTVSSLLHSATHELEIRAVSDPKESVKLLMADVLGMEPLELVLHKDRVLTDDEYSLFAYFLERRKLHEPVAYIVGYKNFRGRDFVVSPAVLIPRPETEELIDILLPYQGKDRLLIDVGTGSGVIPITAMIEGEWLAAIGLEKSLDALSVATYNLRLLPTHKLPHTTLQQSDVLSYTVQQQLEKLPEFRRAKGVVITANLPYIPSGEIVKLDIDVQSFEPILALDGGRDGVEIILVLLEQLMSIARTSKVPMHIILEIASENIPSLTAFAEQHELLSFRVLHDYSGKDRFIHIEV